MSLSNIEILEEAEEYWAIYEIIGRDARAIKFFLTEKEAKSELPNFKSEYPKARVIFFPKDSCI